MVHFPYLFDVLCIINTVRNAFNNGNGADNSGDKSADGNCRPEFSYTIEDMPVLDWITHIQSSWEPIVTDNSIFVLQFLWHNNARVMCACQERERIRMMEVMRCKSNGSIKREGDVVHFKEEDDAEMEEDGEDNGKSTIQKKEKDTGIGGAALTAKEYVQI